MAIDPVSIAIQAALVAASMAIQATQQFEGPRLEDLKATVADHGTPIATFWGTRRLDVPIVFAEDINEVKRRRKTKGGKYNDYTYYGTWFCLIASHEIEAVKRIWFDKHLVYDATGSGPLTPFSTDETLDVTSHIRIMLGGADQDPDPRMETTVDALHGAGSCPAYRGMSGVMFIDVPLEKVGNRFPQVGIEATRAAVPAFPYDQYDTSTTPPNGLAGDGFAFSPDYSYLYWSVGGEPLEVWDVATRSQIGVYTFPEMGNPGDRFAAVSSNGTIHFTGGFLGDHYYTRPLFGGIAGEWYIGENTQDGPIVRMDGDGVEHVFLLPFSSSTDSVIRAPDTIEPCGFYPTDYIADNHGDIWAIGSIHGATDILYFKRVVNTSGRAVADDQEVTMPFGIGGLTQFFGCHVHGADYSNFIVWKPNVLMIIEDETFTVTAYTTSGASGTMRAQMRAIPPDAETIWFGPIGGLTGEMNEYSARDLTLVRTVDKDDWVSTGAFGFIYDPVNHALISPGGDLLTWRYLDRVGNTTVTLRSIIEDVAGQCGLDAGDIDASDCTQEVIGYSITQGTGKAALERLLALYDVDARPHNFQIQFIRRGDAAIDTIDSAEFATGETRFKAAIRQDTGLPSSATLTFADPAGDQQPNTVLVRRALGTSDGTGELAVNYGSLVLSVDEARMLAERLFRRQWNGRESYEDGLGATRLAIEPADVYGLTFDGIARTARNTQLTIGGKNLALKAEWERDAPLLASLVTTTGATFDGRSEDALLIPMLTKGLVVDAALAEDADDQSSPFVYYGAAPYGDGFWPAADIFVSEEGTAGTFDTIWATVSSGEAMDWGTAILALGDALPTVIDYGNTLYVRMANGTLTSSTEADVLDDPTLNLIAVGADGRWEWIQFITATLESDGSYTLTGLLRGRRGTEHAIANHEAGDAVFPAATRRKRPMGASDIGDTDHYKAVTQGRGEAGAWAQSVAYRSAALKPYAPVHADCEKDSGTGDWSIDATRRTRIGGFNIYSDTPPLGETSERWEADILNGSGAVVRTLSGPSLPLTYFDEHQVEDFGATVAAGALDVLLYQVSPALSLRGYPLAIAA